MVSMEWNLFSSMIKLNNFSRPLKNCSQNVKQLTTHSLEYSQTCINRSPLGPEKVALKDR